MASHPHPHSEGSMAAPTPTKAAATTTTTTSTSTGRQSTGLQHPQGRSSTPDPRHFAVSTDDAAIFIEDTIDRATAQCIATSPSALAILSPQRMPAASAHVDVTEYGPDYIGGGAAGSHASSVKKGRRSGLLASGGGGDSAISHGVRLSFGKSPTPKASRRSGSHHTSGLGTAALDVSGARSTPSREAATASSCSSSAVRRRLSGTPSPAAARPHSRGAPPSEGDGEVEPPEPMVPLFELEQVERERNRFEKMYEHQKAMYEDMADKHATVHASLQEKIVEVVALSTRNEESKKFIRQLKREMAESRTRVMDIQNRALQETRAERDAKSRYESLVEEHEHKYRRTVERHETKMAAMESLLKDLTCMRNEHDRVHVSQLDALLKAAYAKSTALFSDLLRQSRQVDLLYDAKDDLERQIDQLRREKRAAEATLAEERRHMRYESERFIEQIEQQQQSILNLRQMLLRALDTTTDDDDEEEGNDNEGYEDNGGVLATRRGAYGQRMSRTYASSEGEEGEDEEEEAAAATVRPHREILILGDDNNDTNAAGDEAGGSATPLRRQSSSSFVVKSRGGGGSERGEVDREPRSSSEKRTLAYLRSQMADSAVSANAPGDGSVVREKAIIRKSSSSSVVTASATSGALSSNAVVVLSQRGREGVAKEDESGSDEGSIFKPPQRRADSGKRMMGKGQTPPSTEEEEEAAHPATRKPPGVSAATSSKPPSLLREREATKPALNKAPLADDGGSGGNTTVIAHRVTEPRHTEPYRIPRSGAGDGGKEDKENAPEGAGGGAAGPRKRLDFVAALASVTAKREQEKRARARSPSADKENGRTATDTGGRTPASTGAASSTVIKSALRPQQQQQAAHRHSSGGADRDDDDDDDVPRLVPKQTQPRPVLRTISQKAPEK